MILSAEEASGPRSERASEAVAPTPRFQKFDESHSIQGVVKRPKGGSNPGKLLDYGAVGAAYAAAARREE